MESHLLQAHPRPRLGEEPVSSARAPPINGVAMVEQMALQNALAATCVDDVPHMPHAWEGTGLLLGMLLHGEAPAVGRLPLH